MMTTKNVQVGAHSLRVRDTGGERPTLLFLHGIMMDGSVWDAQVEAFRGRYRCVCPDLRGYGGSETENPDISFEDHADDMAALIDALSLRDVTWVGWSMGGSIAMIFASRYASRLERLVLVDTTPQLLADEGYPHALPPEAAQELGALLVRDYIAGCRAFVGLMAPEDEAARTRLAAIAEATSPAVSLTAFRTSGARNQIAELSCIEMPTTMIHGRDDSVCLPAAAEFMAERIPGARCIAWIDGAGHAPHVTRPDAFNRVLEAALTS